MASRSQRAEIARETLSILESGRYRTAGGREVSIRDALTAAVAGSVLYTPASLDEVLGRC
jgi:hypothetical protein